MIKTKKGKKLILFMLAVIMVFSVTACGGEDAESEIPVYTAITEPTFPPFDMTDEDGNIIGFDMDLMDAIAADQGFQVEYMALGFDALIPAIEAGNADIITAGMWAGDPERQAKVDFSDTYYDSALVVVVRADETDINSVDDLTADMKVASQIATTGEAKVNELKEAGQIKEGVILDMFSTCMLQLQNGDVEAVIIDQPVANAYIKKQPDKVKTVGETLNEESYGFAVQKGNTELLEKINAGLQNMIDNGTYDELITKWF